MDKKSAIQLSVNFLVIIIISMVVFTFGISFIYNIMRGAESLKDMTLGDIDQRISELMCGTNEKICIEKDTFYLEPKDLKIFTIKILNIEPSVEKLEFLISVKNGSYIDSDNNILEPGEYTNNIIVMPESRVEEIRQNEAKHIGVGFQLPKTGVEPGTYIFNLKVYKGSNEFEENLYDRIHKLYIKVK
ncbi:MAG: hypothetical protein KAK00_06660 [Nanoarchaeota archaeon]|nr:hypothetical protein [Nanoarchaeota archaeon]